MLACAGCCRCFLGLLKPLVLTTHIQLNSNRGILLTASQATTAALGQKLTALVGVQTDFSQGLTCNISVRQRCKQGAQVMQRPASGAAVRHDSEQQASGAAHRQKSGASGPGAAPLPSDQLQGPASCRRTQSSDATAAKISAVLHSGSTSCQSSIQVKQLQLRGLQLDADLQLRGEDST